MRRGLGFGWQHFRGPVDDVQDGERWWRVARLWVAAEAAAARCGCLGDGWERETWRAKDGAAEKGLSDARG